MAVVAEQALSPMGEQALRYLARGLSVFPVCVPIDEHHCKQHGQCSNSGKVPLIKWEVLQKRLPYTQEVKRWWRWRPEANIGMATGKLPGVVVLDADGEMARKEALRRGVPPSPTIWTGRPGGAHYWLRHPGRSVSNFAKKLPGVGIDFRGDGGYVLLPPSLHWTGNTYRWADGTEELPLAALPAWLADLLDERSNGATAETATPGGHVDLVRLLNGIPEGERNSALWSFAGKLRNENIPRVYAEFMVRQAARACRPPLEDDIALDQVRRAYNRYAPEPTWETPEPDESEADPFVAAEPSREPFTVYGACTFLEQASEPITWRIEGFVREQALVWLFGPPGGLKTYISTDAGLAIATGGQFLGRFPATQGTVLIVQEDTLADEYRETYLRAMIGARKLEPDTWLGLEERFLIAPRVGMALDDKSRVQELDIWLTANPVDMVILDAWYLFQGYADGQGKELRTVLRTLAALRRRHPCIWWILDHNRKAGSDGGGHEDAIDRLIGGREKGANADTVLEVKAVKGQAGQVFLDVVKMRGARPIEGVRLHYTDGCLTIEGQRAETPTGAAEEVYEWLCREGGSRTYKQMMAGIGLADRTVRGACSELLMAGRVQRSALPGGTVTWLALRTESGNGEVPW